MHQATRQSSEAVQISKELVKIMEGVMGYADGRSRTGSMGGSGQVKKATRNALPAGGRALEEVRVPERVL